MNDPNYDDYMDFHEGVENEIETDCPFANAVLSYLKDEWEVNLADYPDDVQCAAFDMIGEMKGNNNPPNTASEIAYKVIPI